MGTVTPANLASSENDREDEPQMSSPSYRDPRLGGNKRTIHES